MTVSVTRVTQLVLSLLPVLVITLMPGDATSVALDPRERICLFCGSRAMADAVLNVLLFLPFGWVLGRWKGVVPAVGSGLLMSAGLELVQLYLVGRFSSATDIVANTLGAGAGAWAGTRKPWPVRVAALAVGASLFAPAFLLPPDPPEGIYYGQWTAVFGHMEAYPGRILDARVGGIFTPSRRSSHTDRLRESLRTGEAVQLTVRASPPPSGPAPVFSIFDHRRRQIFMLGADSTDVFVNLWRRGTTYRFSTPEWRWSGALAGAAPGDTIQVEFRMGSGGPCLSVDGGVRCLTTGTVVGSWSLLAPGGQAGLLFETGSVIWALILGMTLGLLRMRRTWRLLVTLGMLAGVATLSGTLPYWPTPWTGMLLVLTGAALTTIMRASRRRRPTPRTTTTT